MSRAEGKGCRIQVARVTCSARVKEARRFRRFLLPPVGRTLPLALVVFSPMQAQSGPEFIEQKIRTQPTTSCYTCNSSGPNVAMSGLRLRSLQGFLIGGRRGPAIVTGNLAGGTLLYPAHLICPPTMGTTLSRTRRVSTTCTPLILHLLGLDHKRLTYRYGVREFGLADMHGELVPGILAQ